MAGTLNPVEPPALPLGPGEYNRLYQDQLNNVQRLFYNRLTNVTNTLVDRNGGAYLQMPHAMLMSDEDQANPSITGANNMTFNQPVITQGIEVRNGNEIWFDLPGQYLVNFRLQVSNASNAVQEFEVWAGFNGQDYPLSNTRFDIPERKSSSIFGHANPSISGIFTVSNPDLDYLTLKWWASSTEVFLEHYAAGVTPTRPEIPSVIMTVNFISRLP
jgi:hypothetical protein